MLDDTEKEIFKLIQNYIRKNKIKGDNYTNHLEIPNCSFSGYIELHSDIDFGVTKNNPYFYIKPLYWVKDATLIHQYRRNWHKNKFDGQVIKFNAVREHGLVPDSVADKLVQDNKIFENKWLSDAKYTKGKVRLVWIWLTAKEYNNPELLKKRMDRVLTDLRLLSVSGPEEVYNKNFANLLK